MLADVTGNRNLDASLYLFEGMPARKRRAGLQDALADPEAAVILLNVVLSQDVLSDLGGEPISQQGRHGPVIVVNSCDLVAMGSGAAWMELSLHKKGIQLAPSSAAAARLAAWAQSDSRPSQ